MTTESAVKTKWQVTQTGFDRLLASLADNHDTAGTKYLLLRKNLVRFFEIRGIATSEEAADEVLNRVARKLDREDKIENVNTYSLGIARMLILELRKSPAQKTSNELPEIPVLDFDEKKEEHEHRLSCLDKCLFSLPLQSRELIIGYYQGEKHEKIENRQKLADRLGIPNNALRNRAVRLRDKLEICIVKCLRRKNNF